MNELTVETPENESITLEIVSPEEYPNISESTTSQKTHFQVNRKQKKDQQLLDKPPFNCIICSDTMKSLADLLAHYKSRHVEKVIKKAGKNPLDSQQCNAIVCSQCDKTCYLSDNPQLAVSTRLRYCVQNIVNHYINTHKIQKPSYVNQYKCDLCSFTSIYKSILKNHLKFVHKIVEEQGRKSIKQENNLEKGTASVISPKSNQLFLNKDNIICIFCHSVQNSLNDYLIHISSSHITQVELQEGDGASQNFPAYICHQPDCSFVTVLDMESDSIMLGLHSFYVHLNMEHTIDVSNICIEYYCSFCPFKSCCQLIVDEHEIEEHCQSVPDVEYSTISLFKESVSFSCFICSGKMENSEKLMDHISNCHIKGVVKHFKDNICSEIVKDSCFFKCSFCSYSTCLDSNKGEQIIKILTHLVQTHDFDLPEYFKRYNCSHCQYSTFSERHLTKHYSKVHKTIRKSEAEDGCEFKQVRNHFQDVDVYNCFLCDSEFPSDQQLVKHFTVEHLKMGKNILGRKKRVKDLESSGSLKYFECAVSSCEYKFVVKSKSVESCGKCGKTLSSASLQRHEKVCRTDVKTDSYCETYYYKLEQYENHMFVKHKQNISNRTIYQCSSCSYSCLSRSRMNNHTKTHLGTQQFRCRICRKGFPTAARLKIHELTHSEVAKGVFECKFCKFNSAIRHYVYRHIATLHPHYKLICKHCSFATPSREAIKIHLNRNHGVRIEIPNMKPENELDVVQLPIDFPIPEADLQHFTETHHFTPEILGSDKQIDYTDGEENVILYALDETKEKEFVEVMTEDLPKAESDVQQY
ncbi:DgyrCDS9066 [Dimorphilus gyrociliatus]|uniref:DgyrCDS9066 n=1 Tax=Dimorphilus gyrociliatus TaxID=2664684 RepID=A0A7I8VXH2_9ANNE|nr:DgyrCDS9066 [Dimorphilus gyrociliatus]